MWGNILLIGAVVLTSSFARAQCDVAVYLMEGNANDASGNGYHGVVFGASGATGIYGIMNKALDFDGVTDHVILNGGQPIISAPPIVIEVVARLEGPGGGPDGTQPMFSQREDALNGTGPVIDFFAKDANGMVACVVRSNGSSQTDTVLAQGKTDGDWHCYKAILGMDDTLRLFVDGMEHDKRPVTLSGGFDSGVNHVQIGRHSYSNATRAFFNGSIEELRITTCDSTPSLCSTLEINDSTGNPPIGGTPPPKVDCVQLSQHNVFTPNGDQINDVFRLDISCPVTSMKVYNRWGKLVWEGSSATWDGTNANGNQASSGVYFYTVTTTDSRFQGAFTLMR